MVKHRNAPPRLLLDTPRAGVKGHRSFVSESVGTDEGATRNLIVTARKALVDQGQFQGIRRWTEPGGEAVGVGQWVVQGGDSAREAVEVLVCLGSKGDESTFQAMEGILTNFPIGERDSANDRHGLVLDSPFLRESLDKLPQSGRIPGIIDEDAGRGRGAGLDFMRVFKMVCVFAALLGMAIWGIKVFLERKAGPPNEPENPSTEGQPNKAPKPSPRPGQEPETNTGKTPDPLADDDPLRKSISRWSIGDPVKDSKANKEVQRFISDFAEKLNVLRKTIEEGKKDSDRFNVYRDEDGKPIFGILDSWEKLEKPWEGSNEIQPDFTQREAGRIANLEWFIMGFNPPKDITVTLKNPESKDRGEWHDVKDPLETRRNKALALKEKSSEDAAVFEAYAELADLIIKKIESKLKELAKPE